MKNERDISPEKMPEVSAPIPPMPEHYRDAAERPAWVKSLFDDTAAGYDRVERWMSLGSGAWYRRQALKRAGLHPGMDVLDVGIGTGLVAREAHRIVGLSGRVVGVDPSVKMRQLAEASIGIETIEGVAEALPFGDGAFDFVSMGYALRHVSDLRVAFAEFLRVLRPGGRLCILEITRPRTVVGRTFLRSYMSSVCTMARIACRSLPRTQELWEYYWDTIDRCVPPESITATLGATGFSDARRGVALGVFSEFVAIKP